MRQLALTESGQRLPQWTMLPEETRREAIELLVKLLRGGVIDEELGDE